MSKEGSNGQAVKRLNEACERLRNLQSGYNNEVRELQFALEAIEAVLRHAAAPAASTFTYLQRLADELIESVKSEAKVAEVLLHLNFNYRPYFLYLQERIRNAISTNETSSEKLEVLALELKEVSQAQTHSGLAYSNSYPALKEVMASWIHEEMSYLETKRSLAGRTSSEEVIRKDFRLGLDLSVAQFACLVHSLIESKVVLNKNLSELATFFAATVVTKKSENISEGSFRRKYYNIEDGARRSVADMLNRVVEWLIKK